MRPLLILILSLATLSSADGLKVGFYNSTCPQAEFIIQAVVHNHFNSDPSIPAAFLRLHFHDCFVRGCESMCDASILIDSTKKSKSEKAAGPNLTVRGFDIIKEAKSNVEAQCPFTVSCADIVALATRDAVALAGGLNYDVPTGRRDGLISNVNDVSLPGPTFTVAQALQSFTAKGLTLDDMVTLLGAHTVGVAHCGFFRDRLFNFHGTGVSDATMDSSQRAMLARICGTRQMPLKRDPAVLLDQNTSFAVDNEYYNQLLANKGVLQIDQELALDGSSAGIVAALASNNDVFQQKFADALIKMGRIQVLEGTAGEIRKKCNAIN